MTHYAWPLPVAWVDTPMTSPQPVADVLKPANVLDLDAGLRRPRVDRAVTASTAVSMCVALRYLAARLRAPAERRQADGRHPGAPISPETP